MGTPPWVGRIVGHGYEAPAQLVANHKNWRVDPKRQKKTLAGALSRIGWVPDVVVNQRTGYVVHGHARVALAISRKEPRIPVTYVDLTPSQEDALRASYDPLDGMTVSGAAQAR